jgi:hypothetical protein
MHNAPPVAYPVGRFAWGRVVFGVALALSAAGLLAWQLQSQNSGALVLSAWVLWLACAAATAYAAPQQVLSDGQLLWNGEAWLWQNGPDDEAPAGEGPAGEDPGWVLVVGLDAGSSMLLLLQRRQESQQGRGLWFCAWVSEQTMPSKWHGFRCAVYSRQKLAQQQEPWA